MYICIAKKTIYVYMWDELTRILPSIEVRSFDTASPLLAICNWWFAVIIYNVSNNLKQWGKFRESWKNNEVYKELELMQPRRIHVKMDKYK